MEVVKEGSEKLRAIAIVSTIVRKLKYMVRITATVTLEITLEVEVK